MLSITRYKLLFGIGIVLLSPAVMTTAWAAEQNIHQQDRLQPFENDILLQSFERTHATVLTLVGQGILPEDARAMADDLMIELRKYLIRTNADQQVLELDILHASTEKREIALKKLMELAAERERTKVQYLQRIQALVSNGDVKEAAMPPPAVPHSVQSQPGETEQNKSDKRWRTRDLDIEVEIAPEDMSKGRHD